MSQKLKKLEYTNTCKKIYSIKYPWNICVASFSNFTSPFLKSVLRPKSERSRLYGNQNPLTKEDHAVH